MWSMTNKGSTKFIRSSCLWSILYLALTLPSFAQFDLPPGNNREPEGNPNFQQAPAPNLPQDLPTANSQIFNNPPAPVMNPGGMPGSFSSQIQEQASGLYPILERNPSLPLGVLQRAWDAPYSSSGQISPGVIRYVWRPDLVMPIRVREFMVTTLHLPNFESISSVVVGDPVIFEVSQIGTASNVIGIRPTHAGADSNITVLATSGNVYSFYVRSEGFNSDQITDITVYVEANPPFTVGQFTTGVSSPGGAAAGANPTMGAIQKSIGGRVSNFTGQPPEYIRKIMFNPEALSFDMKIFAPTPEDAEIAPLRVFNDGVWTYFDFGEKADSMPRPVVYLIQDGVDSLVNTRTVGPYGNLVIAEAVGDFTLRNGTRVVCIYRSQSLAHRQNHTDPSISLENPFLINRDQLVIQSPQKLSTDGNNVESRGQFLDNVSSWFE